MPRLWPALAVLCCGMARGAAPSYSAAGIVRTASYEPGPFAANSLVTIFGKDLALSMHVLVESDIVGGVLPTEMNYTRVYVGNEPAALLFVSEGQINFLLPPKLGREPTPIRVVREGQTGPECVISIVDAAPALFVLQSAFAIAAHGDASVITPDRPAARGEEIAIYAAGLGKTDTMPATNQIPPYASELVNKALFKVTLDGVPVDPTRVRYAGLTPRSTGLYQINIVLPDAGPDPEVRIFVGDAGSQQGLRLPLR